MPGDARLYVNSSDIWQSVSPGIGEHPFLINGFGARVLTWTPEAWELLTERPAAAVLGTNGVRALVVLD